MFILIFVPCLHYQTLRTSYLSRTCLLGQRPCGYPELAWSANTAYTLQCFKPYLFLTWRKEISRNIRNPTASGNSITGTCLLIFPRFSSLWENRVAITIILNAGKIYIIGQLCVFVCLQQYCWFDLACVKVRQVRFALRSNLQCRSVSMPTMKRTEHKFNRTKEAQRKTRTSEEQCCSIRSAVVKMGTDWAIYFIGHTHTYI